jgi:dTDP-4-dehydrorhamnose 3,5-epimerase
MEIEHTSLPGVLVLTPRRFSDSRGFFCETWNRKRIVEAGFDINFVQDNQSISRETGTLRGLHFQMPPHAQAKLVRCGRGALFDVVVDIRHGSPTFGNWLGVELSFDNGKQMLIPEGFLHGFVTHEPNTEIIYKCSDYYTPDCDASVRFDDPDIAIEWSLKAPPILSDKDATAPRLADLPTYFKWRG